MLSSGAEEVRAKEDAQSVLNFNEPSLKSAFEWAAEIWPANLLINTE